MSTYQLRHYRTFKLLSEHPNIEGVKLSALSHVANGDHITWDEDGPVDGMRGYRNGRPEFMIVMDI